MNLSALPQTWDNSYFFKASDDPRIKTVVSELKAKIEQLTQECAPFALRIDDPHGIAEHEFADLIATIRLIHKQKISTLELFYNTTFFISCVLSVDTQDAAATSWLPTLQQIGAELQKALKPLDVFLTRTDEAFIQALIADPVLQELEFSLYHNRSLKDQLLSVAEECLIAGLGVDGLHSWGNLYDDLAGNLKCEVEEASIGLAKAANLLSHRNRETREAAWQGIGQAWESRQETVATILNSINGWRLEETRQRSHSRTLHYLDKSCHESHIDRATLDALMETTYQHRTIGHRALNAMAQALNLEKMAPWDLMAPAPAAGEEQLTSFEAAIELISTAFSQLSPEMGDFVVMMAEKGWIDGKPTPNRSTGAHCGQFSQPREPRVFLTFEGTMHNVMTLAHELGHGWHTWVMRDLPLTIVDYPMTLAETASIFGETLVRDALFQQATSPAHQLEIAWQDAQSAAAFLVNIPARFAFEQRLVEARKSSFVIADQLKEMMSESWQLWYENSLSAYDSMFWASKLHFSISSISFYNYPYLFGYLFSLGIYAQQAHYGDRFPALYQAILRDTGIMTAEELVSHHLQQDIRQPEFWQASLAIVDRAVTRFEDLVATVVEKN